MSHGLIKVANALGGGSFLLAACVSAATRVPTALPVPTHTARPTLTPDITLTWDTFGDPQSGYSFRYPSDWYVTPAQEGRPTTTILTSYDMDTAGPIEEGQYIPGTVKIDLSVSDLVAPDFTLSIEWLASNILPPHAEVQQRFPMTVDGHGAFRIELVVSGTPFSVIYVPIAPSLYTILLAGDLPTHEGTIESFLSTIRLGSPE